MESNVKEGVIFRYFWITRIILRQLGSSEAVVLQVSPKFATVSEHIAFQWSLKMFGTTYLHSEEEGLDGDEILHKCTNFVAISLYFNDGPVSLINLRAFVGIAEESMETVQNPRKLFQDVKTLNLYRGKECDVTGTDQGHISDYIKANVGGVIRLFLLMELPLELFEPATYLNAHSPTPITSFLTANYRARASSKIWKRRSRRSKNLLETNCQRSQRCECKIINNEEIFNRLMDEERESSKPLEESVLTSDSLEQFHIRDKADLRRFDQRNVEDREHLFKKLLVSCCDTCQKKALISQEAQDDSDSSGDELLDGSPFECNEASKENVHDLLANMYFNKVALPKMDFVEDFADFLTEAELNDLPVLKRACERYLCGELISKKDLLTSLLLDLLFLAIVFSLPVMKSIALSELSNRPQDLANPELLSTNSQFKELDRRMKSMSNRNLVELIEEIQRFREQRLRVQLIEC